MIRLFSPHHHSYHRLTTVKFPSKILTLKKVSSLSLSPLHATFIFDINLKVLTVTFHFHTNEETNWYHFFIISIYNTATKCSKNFFHALLPNEPRKQCTQTFLLQRCNANEITQTFFFFSFSNADETKRFLFNVAMRTKSFKRFFPNANKTERFLAIVAVRTRQNVSSLTLQRGFEARTKHSSETTNRRRAFHGKDNTELSLSLSLYSSPLGVVEWQFVFAIICPPFIDSFKL